MRSVKWEARAFDGDKQGVGQADEGTRTLADSSTQRTTLTRPSTTLSSASP